ncbi:MAG: YlxR family protein [Acutalibacteraceae bacterium]|nr:YlxR family protein [Acutalibacteraceae bacterium]
MVKKIPIRQCTGCSERKPKNELIRIVKTPEDKIVLDFSGKQNGRGAYICRNENCLTLAVKKKRIDNAFGVTVPEEVLECLKKELTSGE